MTEPVVPHWKEWNPSARCHLELPAPEALRVSNAPFGTRIYTLKGNLYTEIKQKILK